jgi:tetratricopeptide (TPR) repeat protein
MADTESEAKKVLELDANNASAHLVLALLYSRQERWAEALSCAENASTRIPYSVGVLGGILAHIGQVNRAEELRRKLLPCDIYGAPLGLYYFYFISGELEKAAKWLVKAIEHRQATFHIASAYLRSTAHWPTIARAMNLPEEAG